ncbi:hypothetical protein [Pseudoalteromonas sp. APC 3250]|uniref:hypothetical protein n=1 Tax=Pseudoalteromonas sp. APC 3250 TaxID=3035184 RepID=UPI0007974B8B|nr:hypothetical protein [Pseudoalteromonas sp. APC 3250]KXJ50352.1 MAG: hypothetical protein AXW15_12725 [Neptuniibacter sp. Phe_28]MDN3414525.1 hypothetical protein [Pseudoalteromonas sp. APC 3250]
MNPHHLRRHSELRPYFPAAYIYKMQLKGVDELPNIEWLHEDIEPSSEEELVHHLLSHPVFMTSVQNERGEEWDVRMESFISFRESSESVTVSHISDEDYDQKIMEIAMWLISLCHWDRGNQDSLDSH